MNVLEAMARAFDHAASQDDLPDKIEHGLRAALAEARRLGWQLVPVEPTEKMQYAGYYDADHSIEGVGNLAPEPEAQPRLIYRAMLASAPSIEEG